MEDNTYRRSFAYMDSKKQIRKFINPSFVPVIILFLIIGFGTFFSLILLLTVTLPTMNRAKKSVEKLEAAGMLDKAAAELMGPSAKRYVKGNLILTENFVFCKRSGIVCTYDDVVWAYKQRFTKRFLFIPIKVTDSVYLATSAVKPRAVASMGKDKMDEIKKALIEIYSHNPKCLIGYSNENDAAYKQMCK